jgi:ADP-dependent NAD(P)H-hydrate dehydratase
MPEIAVTSQPELVTPGLLRGWELPSGADSKYGRGQVLVVGGAAATPGAAMLSGLAALRVGAGHLSLAVAESAAVSLAVAFPEAGVFPLPQNPAGSVRGSDIASVSKLLDGLDAVVVGPGLDDADLTAELLENLLPALDDETQVLLDAYALGTLGADGELAAPVRGRLVLSPNDEEASRLLGRAVDDLHADALEIAAKFDAVVTCGGLVADADGHAWQVSTGHCCLATSGSGDVLAGAIVGLLARGAGRPQAASWATYLHAAAGDRLAARVGKLGFLARELLDELPLVLVELSA